MTRTALFLAALATMPLSGCARQHITSTYARSNSATFRTQAVPPQRPKRPDALLGLDSQEASIIANSYRKGIGGTQAAPSQRDQVLIVSPSGQEGRMPLAPSVPR
jgi:hypothetical protein